MDKCVPTILNRVILESDWDFMTKEKITKDCKDCLQQELCKTVVDLLNNAQLSKALDVLTTIHQWKKD